MRGAILGLALVLVACGGEPQTTVTEVNLPPSPGSYDAIPSPFDTVAFEDSLAFDSLAADTAALADTAAVAVGPSFPEFLTDLKALVRDERPARVADLASGEAAATLGSGWGYGFAFEGVLGERFLAALPERYRRDGTRRTLALVVGFDTDGNVVPEDEAETESGATYVFDVVDGAYRLVRLDLAG